MLENNNSEVNKSTIKSELDACQQITFETREILINLGSLIDEISGPLVQAKEGDTMKEMKQMKPESVLEVLQYLKGQQRSNLQNLISYSERLRNTLG